MLEIKVGLYIERLGMPNQGSNKNIINIASDKLTNIALTNKITPNFNETTVFGRNDVLATYKNTTRTINFVADVVNLDPIENMALVNQFQTLMYPIYDNFNVVIVTPIFKIKYNNLICDVNNQDDCLIGIIKDLDIGENFGYGRVVGDTGGSVGGTAASIANISSLANAGILRYTKFKVAFNIIPLHRKPIGWKSDNTFTVPNNNFPFKNNI